MLRALTESEIEFQIDTPIYILVKEFFIWSVLENLKEKLLQLIAYYNDVLYWFSQTYREDF